MTRATQTPTAEAEAPEAEPTAGTRPPATPAAFPAPAEPQPLAKAPAPGAQPPADAPIPAQATPEPPTPLKRLIPACLTTLSAALWKATALELAILAGHLLLYPTGITQERATPAPTTPDDKATRLPAPPRPPVVLLHGFIDNRSVFVLLRRALAEHGTRTLTSLNYSPLTCDIRTAAELLARHIEDVCERTGSRQVDVVGHSLGGLIARYYVQRLGGDTRVRTLVTLGTPHGGTRAVPLANAHPIVRQMRPGSPVMEELERPAPGCRTRFVSFWSDMDQVMDPPETACVDHPDLLAENIRVTGIGHLALPVHPAVAAGIREALDANLPHQAASDTRRNGLTVA
ncbi:esterase/lipase family protein [Streptomyces acidiscabies]|uniref:Alpha/beta fold hydrolase n=1 Tax=Streptomyces acidiscabies TaxID=42234 RepID=A0AAP6BH19_9ACTN|nr:alpha/beta fold hydrolase [Streptomyces acidiscabies]MBP5937460.1 alpha/beta fold hydrolase [Streptomyces sp. LBUM 1476]MBZ3914460.1 alpha/beta fold hydrolase [Streptomyces acidiscabies]MDX2964327.1 alpha/beta fold hydrolase [Streptomyces acidiscabies]MDX3017148.1 alpha/beta fold hydrolase [Streptomyces acidiscabies]MDX3789099.1 alpha/beta fold hydrolase [Streptomyces acidiscabies]